MGQTPSYPTTNKKIKHSMSNIINSKFAVIAFYYATKVFYFSTNEMLMLFIIICNVYIKVVQYVHFNIFNFKMFCKDHHLHSFLKKRNLCKYI